MKDNVLSHLPSAHPWRQQLHWFDSIPSTNSEARTMAAAGAPHGTVLMAGAQSAGRGRLGRSFSSPAGSGIYISVILRPACPPAQLMHLTCAVGVAVCDAMEEAIGFRPGLKWINDLVAGGKKLGGILTELSIEPKTGLVEHAIVGIGINCHQKASDFPPELQPIACSVKMATGQTADTPALAAAIVIHLEKMSRRLQNRSSIMAQYCRDCVTLGKQVCVIQGDTCRTGKALEVLEDGSLVVAFDDGTTAPVNSGEVSVRGLFGYV